MSDRKHTLILSVLWLLAAASCVSAIMASCAYQDKLPMTPAGRGLYLVDQYDNLEATYVNYLRHADPEAEAWARANIGTTLDRMRLALTTYSDVIAAGDDATEARLKVVELARQAMLKIAEAKEK